MRERGRGKAGTESDGQKDEERRRGSASAQKPSLDAVPRVLGMQRAIGNQAVTRLFAGGVLQPKLEVGPAGDRYEHEADEIAEQVMRNLTPSGPSAPAADEDARVRRSAPPGIVGLEGGPMAAETEAAIQSGRGSGSALPDGVRRSMEASFGTDFGGVRVHTGPSADGLNRSLSSKAFTVGGDIYFARGQYQPATKEGQTLLAHELTHTIQQGAVGKIARKPGDGSPVVQRALGVNNPLAVNDVATVKRVDAKVWILEGHQHDSVVIKMEPFQGGEGAEGFAARHEYVTYLAEQVLAGVPGATALTPTEVALLSQLPAEQDPQHHGGPGHTLTDYVTTPGAPYLYLKVERVAMGKNLEARINAQQQGGGGGGGAWGHALTPLKVITAPGTLRELGKQAAFDLVVNNPDRFRPIDEGYPGGRVNMKNIDFNQNARPIAIDNLDPNNRILTSEEAQERNAPEWEGGPHVLTKRARSSYAAATVTDLMTAIGGIATDRQTLKPYILEFRTGMEEAVTTMKGLAGVLRLKGMGDRGKKQKVGNLIANRLDQLQQ
jgi:hypothetical protein